ncbi:MAG: hypothetical protein JW869_04635 [Candidatus Omnitrophica bacterium]|nr:hypothetical protein [Candidatus Omnitrophota bacterium]
MSKKTKASLVKKHKGLFLLPVLLFTLLIFFIHFQESKAITSAKVRVNAMESDTGYGISGVTIDLSIGSYQATQKTDDTAKTEFSVVPPGRATIMARCPGYQSVAKTIDVRDVTYTQYFKIYLTKSKVQPPPVPPPAPDIPTESEEDNDQKHEAFERIFDGLDRLRDLSDKDQYDKTIHPDVVSGPKILVKVVKAGTTVGVPGADVALTKGSFGTAALTDQNGNTRFSGITEGMYKVCCSAKGYTEASQYIKVIAVDYEQPFYISVAEEKSALSSGTVSISGKVFDDMSRQPIEQALVELVTDGYPKETLKQTTTDKEGKYKIDDCPINTPLRIICSKEGYRTNDIYQCFSTAYSYTQEIPLEKTKSWTEETPTAAEVVIRVLEKDTEEVIAGANVNLAMAEYSNDAVSDQAGEVKLKDVPVGMLKVTCSASGYEDASKDINVMDKDYAQYFRVHLPKAEVMGRPLSISLLIRVIEEKKVAGKRVTSRERIAGAQVDLSIDDYSMQAVTNNVGEVFISGVPAGAGNISCTAQGYSPEDKAFTVNEKDSIQHIDIYLNRVILREVPSQPPVPPELNIEEVSPDLIQDRQYVELLDLKDPIFARVGDNIVARNGNNAVALFSKDDPTEPLWVFPGDDSQEDIRINANDISELGNYVAAAGSEILKFRSDSSTPLWRFAECEECKSVAISGNGRYVVAGNERGTVFLFEGDTAEPHYQWDLKRDDGNNERIQKIDISHDGEYIAVAGLYTLYLISKDSFVSQSIHDGNSGCLWIKSVDEAEIADMHISYDGNYVAANTDTSIADERGLRRIGILYLFDRRGYLCEQEIRSLNTPSSAISKYGEYIAVGTNDRVAEYRYSSESNEIVRLWSCSKQEDQSIVDISGDGNYVYSYNGSRVHLWDRDYLIGGPHDEKAFRIYDAEDGYYEWISMTEPGDYFVFIDGGKLSVVEVMPALLLDITDYAPIYSAKPPINEQNLRFYIANPGKAVPGAMLRAMFYLPQIGFFVDLPGLALKEEKYTTVEEAVAVAARDSRAAYDVLDPTNIALSPAHRDFDLRVTLPVENFVGEWVEDMFNDMNVPGFLSDLLGDLAAGAAAAETVPVGMPMMTVGHLYSSNPRFDAVDLVAWMYIDVVIGEDAVSSATNEFGSAYEAATDQTWEQAGEEFTELTGLNLDDVCATSITTVGSLLGGEGEASVLTPAEGEVPLPDIDLIPVHFIFVDDTQHIDATGSRNPTLEANKNYGLRIGIKNDGPETLNAVTPIKIEGTPDPGTLDRNCSISRVEALDTSDTWLYDVSLPAGEYDFTITVNPQREVYESKYGNNFMFASATFTEAGGSGSGAGGGTGGGAGGGGQPVAVDDLDLEPIKFFVDGREAPEANDLTWSAAIEHTLSVEILNYGPDDLLENVDVEITAMSDATGLSTINCSTEEAIVATDTKKAQATNLTFQPGLVNFTIVINPAGSISENRMNNIIHGTATFELGQAGQPVVQEIDLIPVSFTIAGIGAQAMNNPELEAEVSHRMIVGVRNDGNQDLVDPVDVEIEIVQAAETATATGTINEIIPAQDTGYAKVDYSFGVGPTTFNITVDPARAIFEDHDNNMFPGSATFVLTQFPVDDEVPGPVAIPDDDAGAGGGDGQGQDDWMLILGAFIDVMIDRAGGGGGPGPDDGGVVVPDVDVDIHIVPPVLPVPPLPDDDGVIEDEREEKGGEVEPDVDIVTDREVTEEKEKDKIEKVRPPVTTLIEERKRRAQQVQRLRTLGLYTACLALLLYVYLSLALHIIAKKAGTSKRWLAWIPIASLYLMCKIANRPGWWTLLFFVPVVNLVIAIIVWEVIARACNKAGWLGVLIIIPFVNLLVPGYLAFSK